MKKQTTKVASLTKDQAVKELKQIVSELSQETPCIEYKTKTGETEYMEDFFFVAPTLKRRANALIKHIVSL
jgi:hypothetical protein